MQSNLTELEISHKVRYHENNLITWRFLETLGRDCKGAIAYDLERVAHYKSLTPRVN
jgi:hypothetical protein